jgi:hypothetical protein
VRRAIPAAAALLLVAGPVSAQWAEAVELGVLARLGVYDGDVGVENAAAGGIRIGVLFRPSLAVEADWTYAEPDLVEQPGLEGRRFISHELFGLRVLYARSVAARTDLLVGVGLAYDRYTRVREVGARGGGPGGLLGFRVRISEAVSARFEATGYRVGSDPDAPIPRPSTVNLGLQAGLSVSLRDRERIVELPPPPPDTVLVERVVGLQGEYAEGREWFDDGEPVILTPDEHGVPRRLEYRRTGGELRLDGQDIVRVGTYRGVAVFARHGAETPHRRIYVPVRPGDWQAYELGPASDPAGLFLPDPEVSS